MSFSITPAASHQPFLAQAAQFMGMNRNRESHTPKRGESALQQQAQFNEAKFGQDSFQVHPVKNTAFQLSLNQLIAQFFNTGYKVNEVPQAQRKPFAYSWVA